MVLYFLIAYIAVGVAVPFVKRWHARRYPTQALMTFALCLSLFALPWAPYAVVAAQTFLFGNALLPAVHRAYDAYGGMCGDPSDKILTYQVL